MALVGGEKLGSHNLRDFLRVKDDDRHSNLNQSTSSGGGGGRHNPPGLTLNAILTAKRSPAPPRPAADEPPLQRNESNRTLLDIIREDQSSGIGADQRDSRRSWKQLREKICLRNRGGGSAWLPTDIPATTRHHTISTTRLNSAEPTQVTSTPGREIGRASGGFEPNISEVGGDAVRGEDGAAEQPVRMSLMALLAENDRQMGFEGSAYVTGEDKENVAAQEESVAVSGAGAGEYNNCCVCMLRHKGAAFIPCGHTFCRLCSRELLAQRGNCPLCNNNILEILDIF